MTGIDDARLSSAKLSSGAGIRISIEEGVQVEEALDIIRSRTITHSQFVDVAFAVVVVFTGDRIEQICSPDVAAKDVYCNHVRLTSCLAGQVGETCGECVQGYSCT